MIPSFDLYAELGVDPSASSEAIEAAYRVLIKRHHPDLAGEAGVERSKRLNVAYAWLRDPARRDDYDAARAVPIVVDEEPAPKGAATDWTAQRPWWPGPNPSHQASGPTRAGTYQARDHPHAERPRRPARQPPARRSDSVGGEPASATHPLRGARQPPQEPRVLGARLVKLAAAAVAIAIVVSAVQNGGAIIGGRQPQATPLAAATLPDVVANGNAATASPTEGPTSTAAITLKPDVILEGRHPYWTSTGVHVTAGERLLIAATGQILWDPGVREPTVGPGGASWTPDNVASPEEFLFQQSPIASLIGDVGGTMFWIGASQEITAPASGELKLAMNERWVDGSWDDNQGSWAVVVEPEPR